ncbi:MAG: hypothetical protein ACSHYB_18310 [Roseibacillus sp.]
MRVIVMLGFLALVLASCGPREPLVVKQFTVKDVNPSWSDDLLVRGESQKRLYGAVEQIDREKRKGQYYSVRWRANPAGGPAKVRFQYRQASTGSRVHELVQTVAATKGTGVVEFSIAGDTYLKGGRVLAWRMLLSQNGQDLAEKKSFLWE